MSSREAKGKGICRDDDEVPISNVVRDSRRVDPVVELRRRESTATRDAFTSSSGPIPDSSIPAEETEGSDYRDCIAPDDSDADTETDIDEVDEKVRDEFLPARVELTKKSLKDLVNDGRSWMDEALLAELRLKCNFPKKVKIRLPRSNERLWDAPPGYFCIYECFFSLCGLHFPLPQLLFDYCQNHRLAISQLSHSIVRHMVCCIAVARTMEMEFNADIFERI